MAIAGVPEASSQSASVNEDGRLLLATLCSDMRSTTSLLLATFLVASAAAAQTEPPPGPGDLPEVDVARALLGDRDPLLDLYAKDVTFRTGRPSVGPHIATVLGLVRDGRVHPGRVSSGEFPFDDAIEVLSERRLLKPVLVRAEKEGPCREPS